MYPPLSPGEAGFVDVLVIGAGHSGLAMSRMLSERSIDHVILERGAVANSWSRERWDSLRLLTPNWQTRLPGFQYAGTDPDGYMTMPEVIRFIQSYSSHINAPVITDARVTRVRRHETGYFVESTQGNWIARCVVVASGAFNIPVVPRVAEQIPHSVEQLTTREYRNPDSIQEGGVLVVGASATGLQLAEEIKDSGRPVTLAAGEHVRMPRVYRGRDIQFWMDKAGLLDQSLDTVDDLRRARGVPSPQLIGSDERRTLDLNVLTRKGVRLAGRLAAVSDNKAQFSGSLRNVCALADLKMDRMLDGIDDWIGKHGYDIRAEPATRYAPTVVEKAPLLNLDFGSGEIKTVLWTTGYRPDYSWLDVPVLDRKGRIEHDGGVAKTAGLYLLGLPFLRRRKSSFIHGAEDDAREIAARVGVYLDQVSLSRLLRRAV
jgi:putative flavoprotein involved in K+ transport